MFATILSTPTMSSFGTVQTHEILPTVYRYNANNYDGPLKVGDCVKGNIFGQTFCIIGKGPQPGVLYIVDFIKKRYQVVHPDGQVIGWYETKKERKSWFNFFRGL